MWDDGCFRAAVREMSQLGSSLTFGLIEPGPVSCRPNVGIVAGTFR